MLLLVPADPLRPRRPDRHFAAEAAAARAAGHDVALIDHDALTEPDGAERAVARVPEGGGTAVYRGWMLASGRYAALAARGVGLRTSAAQYRRAQAEVESIVEEFTAKGPAMTPTPAPTPTGISSRGSSPAWPSSSSRSTMN